MKIQSKLIVLSSISTIFFCSSLFALDTSSCLSSGLANHFPVNGQLNHDGAIDFSKMKKGVKPKVWIYTKIQGKNDADRIAHLWRKNDLKTDYVRKSVVAGKMFYSYKMLDNLDEGDWAVEVRDQEGKSLNLIEFKAVRKNKQMMIIPKNEKNLDCHFSNQTTTKASSQKETINEAPQQISTAIQKKMALYPIFEAGYVFHQTDLKNEANKNGIAGDVGVSLELKKSFGLLSLQLFYGGESIKGKFNNRNQKISGAHFGTALSYRYALLEEKLEVGGAARIRVGEGAKFNWPNKQDMQVVFSVGPECLYNFSIKGIPFRAGLGAYMDVNNSDQKVVSTLLKLEWKYDLLTFAKN